MNTIPTVLITRLETSGDCPSQVLITYGAGCPRPGDAVIANYLPEGDYEITSISGPSVRPALYGGTGGVGKAFDLSDALPWYPGQEGETTALPLSAVRRVIYRDRV